MKKKNHNSDDKRNKRNQNFQVISIKSYHYYY